MTKKPKPSPPPAQWDIYIAKAKARLLGTVEAKDAEAAIAEAAKEFEVKEPTGWQGVCLPRQRDKIDRFEKANSWSGRRLIGITLPPLRDVRKITLGRYFVSFKPKLWRRASPRPHSSSQ